MNKFVVTWSNGYNGLEGHKYYKADKIEDVYRYLLINTFDKSYIANYNKDKDSTFWNKKYRKNIDVTNIDEMTNEDITNIFEYIHSSGEGSQWGNPGKEWTNIDVRKYKEPEFEDLPFDKPVKNAYT